MADAAEVPAEVAPEEVAAEAAAEEVAALESEVAPEPEPEPEPEAVPLSATVLDVVGGETSSVKAIVSIEGGCGDECFVEAAGWNVAGNGLVFSMGKSNLTMGDSGKYSYTVTCGAEVLNQKFALKVGPAPSVAFDGKYPKGVLEEDAAFRSNLKKVQKFKIESKTDQAGEDIWQLLKSANPREYDRLAFDWGIADLRKLLKKLANAKKNNKKSTTFPVKLDDTICCKVGEKVTFNVKTANEAMNVRWFFNGKDVGAKGRMFAKGVNKALTIEEVDAECNGTWSCHVGEDKTCCDMFVRKPSVTLTSFFEDSQVAVGQNAIFKAAMSAADGRYKLLKDGIEFGTTDKIAVAVEACNITVTVLNVTAEDAGFYQVKTNGGKSFGELLVNSAPVAVKPDFTIGASGDVEISCTLGMPKALGKWFKNNKVVVEDDNHVVAEDAAVRTLSFAMGSADQGVYEFRTEGTALPAKAFAVTSNGISKSLGAAQVNLVTGESSISTRVGRSFTLGVADAVAIKCEGKDVQADGERMKTTENALVCTNAFAVDSAAYTLGDQSISVLVRDVPTAPGKPVISELTDETCRIDWTPPQSNGGSPVTGYAIERKRAGAGTNWCRVASNVAVHNCTLRRLVDGASYNVRVIAVSAVGESECSQFSESFTPLAPSTPVTGFKTGKLTDNSIELKWVIPEEIGAAGIDGYVIQLQILPGGLRDADPEDTDEDAWKEAIAGYVNADESSASLNRLTTGKNYMFRMTAKNAAGASPWAPLGPICCAALVEDPKIILPRPLRKQIKISVNEKLHLNVPFQGAPKPVVTWTKITEVPAAPIEAPAPVEAPAVVEGEEAAPVAPVVVAPVVVAEPVLEENPLEGYFTIRTAADSSVIFLRNAQRHDTGLYKMKVTVQDLTTEATIDVAVVDIPSKPRKVQIVETIGNSVQLKWEAPKDNGNIEITGYQIEKRDKRSGEQGGWYVVYDKVRHTYCNVDDLILGNDYQFRIRAINEVGLGEGAATKEFATIAKESVTYQKPEYPEMVFNVKPEFTTSLNNRKLMVGYSGVVTCSLKAHPRPKVRWFKNKTEIIDNPKYKMSWGQGIVQLEIRRARLADGGTYTVIAENELGDVTQSCEVKVAEPAPSFKSEKA